MPHSANYDPPSMSYESSDDSPVMVSERISRPSSPSSFSNTRPALPQNEYGTYSSPNAATTSESNLVRSSEGETTRNLSQSTVKTSFTTGTALPAAGETPVLKERETATVEEAPTASHALAKESHEIKGAAQKIHTEREILDLGWQKDPVDIPNLVGGLENAQLWTLVRRFNKQMYHVKAIDTYPPGGLDLNIADEEEFSPDKLKSNVERLYMTTAMGGVSVFKHLARLRSWNEWKRTAGFCAAYFVAWILNLVLPLIFATLLVLIVLPRSRHFLFPPAPLAIVSSKTGGLQKPKAGVLGSDDSLTGAPEKYRGEAVEQEASNFVTSVASVALSSAVGKHPQNDPEDVDGAMDSKAPDPANIATNLADANKKVHGGKPDEKHDKTKQPMEEVVWGKMRPIMHTLADIADGYERFGNALSPSQPFPQAQFRLRIAAVVAPIFLASLFVPVSYVWRGTTFGAGFGFFGDPIISRGSTWLNKTYPNWMKLLELRNTLLKGVPTNAQLTLTLLRVGEANKAPIPPPPQSTLPTPSQAHDEAGKDLPMDASQEEVDDVIHPDSSTDLDAAKTADEPKQEKQKRGTRLISFVRGATRTGVETVLGTDRLKAKIGSTTSKNRVGAVPSQEAALIAAGPVDFPARFEGRRGRVYITTISTSPCVAFTHESKNIKPVFSIAIPDLRELKKVGGFGWKAKLVVGWAMNREIADGIEIVDSTGHRTNFTAMQLRDELFNRLVAMGQQIWESW